MQPIEVLARWSSAGTLLSCVAVLRPGPAMIHMPSCRVEVRDEARLRSEAGSVVVLSDWEDASIETSWRGTKIEVTCGHGAVVIADYDCAGEMKEVMH